MHCAEGPAHRPGYAERGVWGPSAPLVPRVLRKQYGRRSPDAGATADEARRRRLLEPRSTGRARLRGGFRATLSELGVEVELVQHNPRAPREHLLGSLQPRVQAKLAGPRARSRRRRRTCRGSHLRAVEGHVLDDGPPPALASLASALLLFLSESPNSLPLSSTYDPRRRRHRWDTPRGLECPVPAVPSRPSDRDNTAPRSPRWWRRPLRARVRARAIYLRKAVLVGVGRPTTCSTARRRARLSTRGYPSSAAATSSRRPRFLRHFADLGGRAPDDVLDVPVRLGRMAIR